MKIIRFAILLFLTLWLFGTTPATAQPGSSPDPNREGLKSLLDELRQTIDEADKRMVAHPKFLDELRAMVERYKTRLREVFLYEDFADRNYTKDPTWVVKSGRFRITPDNRLWSQVSVIRQKSPPPSQEEDPLGLLLKEIIRSTKKEKGDKLTTPVQKKSVVQTLVRIGPAFEVDLSFVSQSTWGDMEIVLLGGDPPVHRYRLIYHAASSRKRPIEIIRERGSRRYIIESATRYPVLDDGSLHRLQWTRDGQGHMRVLVDGKEVLSTIELFYRDDFAGLQLINRGGTYEWGPIRVLQARQAIQP